MPEEAAVSEIVGVVMLLAMLISVMSGVVVLIGPYLSDFEDQRDWAASHVLAEQVSDRIDVIGAAPEDTGSRSSLEMRAINLLMLQDVEQWTIEADLVESERVQISYLQGRIVLDCQNSSCSELRLDSGETTTTWTLQATSEQQEFQISQPLSDISIFDVKDSDGNLLHRLAILTLSGLEIKTEMNTGSLELALINGASIERQPGRPWSISEYPTIRFDELPDGTPRVSMMLTDLDFGERLPNSGNPVMELESLGAINLFDGKVWNFRFEMTNQMHDNIDPQYIHHWTQGYEIHLATNTLDEYSGFAPYERKSGSDGLTIIPSANFILEVGVQRVVVGT
jgi:hypothetical protein